MAICIVVNVSFRQSYMLKKQNQRLSDYADEFIKICRHLHAHPDWVGKEFRNQIHPGQINWMVPSRTK